MDPIKEPLTSDSMLLNLAIELKIPLDYIIFREDIRGINFNTRKAICLIINLDDKENQGTHWVAAYKPQNIAKIYYFDSYGVGPPLELLSLKKSIFYNDKQIQSIYSGGCGQFCLSFLGEMTKKNNKTPKQKYKQFMNSFNFA